MLLNSKKAISFYAISCILLIIYNKPKKYQPLYQLTKQSDYKFILQWTMPRRIPFVYMGKGQQGFIERKCPYTNCIVTSNRTYLDSYTKFDVIAFAGPEIIYQYDLPIKRSPHQKFVFASIESAHNYPVCTNRFDGYFNWTWTYRLDSEVKWGYIVIRDSTNTIVGPNKEMNWIKLEDMDPVSKELKKVLRKKHKAVAWIVSNCITRSEREKFVESLQIELNKYELVIDIFGHCYDLQCTECDRLIKDTYYFYLSFENGLSEDYVTEKLLIAIDNNAVPIVYGGANYTRFMPDGSYLNAIELGIQNLANRIAELIMKPSEYFNYFKWKKHYSYHRISDSVDTDPYCAFCRSLNDPVMMSNITAYENFREWWDPPNLC